MTSLAKTSKENEKEKSDLMYRLMFKLYFPPENFMHLSKTLEVLMSKILSSSCLNHQVSYHYYVDTDIANASAVLRINNLTQKIVNQAKGKDK